MDEMNADAEDQNWAELPGKQIEEPEMRIDESEVNFFALCAFLRGKKNTYQADIIQPQENAKNAKMKTRFKTRITDFLVLITRPSIETI